LSKTLASVLTAVLRNLLVLTKKYIPKPSPLRPGKVMSIPTILAAFTQPDVRILEGLLSAFVSLVLIVCSPQNRTIQYHRTILPIACPNSTENFRHILQQKSDLYATRLWANLLTVVFITAYAIIETVIKDRLSIKKTGQNNRKYTETPVSENRRNELFRPVEMLFI